MFREKYIPKILASPDFDYSKLKDEELKGVIGVIVFRSCEIVE